MIRTLRHREAEVLGRRAFPELSVLHFRRHLPSYTCIPAQWHLPTGEALILRPLCSLLNVYLKQAVSLCFGVAALCTQKVLNK